MIKTHDSMSSCSSYSQIHRAWEGKRADLKNKCLLLCADRYGIFAKIRDTDGAERDPTAEEVAQRVRYLLGPDLRFACHDFDPLVSVVSTHRISLLFYFSQGNRLGFDHPFLLEMMEYFVFRSVGNLAEALPERFGTRYSKYTVSIVSSAVRQFLLDGLMIN
jgi:hypothetical protein